MSQTPSHSYTPLSSSILSSPPPLSSAGLSSRLTHPVRPSPAYRLSTLLPNASGYLSFFRTASQGQYDNSPEYGYCQGHKKRSASFDLKAFFPSVAGRIKRSFSHPSSAPSPAATTSVTSIQHLERSSTLTLRQYSRSRDSPTSQPSPTREVSNFAAIEDGWKAQSKGLKGEYKLCLLGARCVSITDPISEADTRGHVITPTVIIVSSEDPLARCLPESHLESGQEPMTKLTFTPNVESTSCNQSTSMPPTVASTSFDTGRQERHCDRAGSEKVTLSDVQSGTPAGSTRRTPTQKSVHRTLGRKAALGSECLGATITSPRTMSAPAPASAPASNRGSKLIVTNPDMVMDFGENEDGENEDGEADHIRVINTASRGFHPLSSSTFTVQDGATPGSNSRWSNPIIIDGIDSVDAMPHHRFIPQPLKTPPRIGHGIDSLVLDSEEYQYLLRLQIEGLGALPDFSRPDATSSDGGLSAFQPCTIGTCTRASDSSLDIGLRTEGSTHIRPVNPTSKALITPRQITQTSHIEHLRRSYIRDYNSSPTPGTAWVIVNPSGSAANGEEDVDEERAQGKRPGHWLSVGGRKRNTGRVGRWKRKRREE